MFGQSASAGTGRCKAKEASNAGKLMVRARAVDGTGTS